MLRHTFDAISFAFGILFLVITAAVVVDTDLGWSLSDWIVPLGILVLGIGLLVSGMRASFRKPEPAVHVAEEAGLSSEPDVTDQ